MEGNLLNSIRVWSKIIFFNTWILSQVKEITHSVYKQSDDNTSEDGCNTKPMIIFSFNTVKLLSKFSHNSVLIKAVREEYAFQTNQGFQYC